MNPAQALKLFMSLYPMQYKRIATGEQVLAIKSEDGQPWEFEDFKTGDYIIYDTQRTFGDQLYRCPPKRFHIIYSGMLA